MNIFLDDIRMPGDVTWVALPKLPSDESWTIVRSYNQFCDVVKRCMFDNTPVVRVCFDHDLGTDMDGRHCAVVLVDAALACDWDVPTYVVHSMNPIGAKKIDETMQDIEKARAEIKDWAEMPHPWKTARNT